MLGIADTWMTPQEQYGGDFMYFFSLVFFTFEEVVAIYFNCIELAATLFTSETPKDSNTSPTPPSP